MQKTHFRRVFKSDHLGVADLEDLIEQGKELKFTIKEVKQEIGVMVAGKKGNHNIAYFVENIKPLVLNSTNSKIVKGFNGGSPFVEDWSNTPVELYIKDNVRFGRDVVEGVRIKEVQPKKEKPIFSEANFEKAKQAGATIEAIKNIYQISNEVEQKYIDYVTKK
jgi:hypothetical protein